MRRDRGFTINVGPLPPALPPDEAVDAMRAHARMIVGLFGRSGQIRGEEYLLALCAVELGAIRQLLETAGAESP